MSRTGTDEELMRAYQLGDPEAFDVLYARHSPRVLGYLRKRLGNEADSRDAFQGTFLKLHRSRSRYRAGHAFLPWLFAICRSECVDAARRRARLSREYGGFAEDLPAEEPAETTVVPPGIGELPARQRQAIDLRYQEELSFEEIARRLETSPQNARQLISRGIRFLRSLYDKQ